MRRTKKTTLTLAIAAGALTLAVWPGCSATKQTELVPGVQTQIQVPKDLKAVRVDVQADGEPSSCILAEVNPAMPGFITLPRTLGVIPGGSLSRAVTVTVTGYSVDDGDVSVLQDCTIPPEGANGTYDSNVRVLRRARMTYVGDQILFLPMSLHFSCYDATQCPIDQTCKAGQCVSDTVDPSTLPEFTGDLVNGTSNTCFSVSKCFGAEQPATLVNAATCTYGFTETPPVVEGLNVRVFYDGDGGESEVLDLDPDEGFTIDPSNSKQFKLAPGLCALANGTSHPPHSIYAVDVTSLCPSKGLYQPICAADAVAGGPAALPDGGTSADGGCNVAKELVPAPSALYVLMDDSASMASFFGMQGLQTVTSLSLSDPVFRTAAVGFKLLPHDASDCTDTTNTVATPDVPFAPATTAQTAVAAIIGDATKVQMGSPPMLIDAALRGNGAYAALQAYATSSGLAFNRLAVMLVVNRPAATDCNIAELNPSNEAFTAFDSNNPIYTYVVALGNNDVDGGGTPDVSMLSMIAQEGGTSFFDATTDATVGAKAFSQIESDLGSCLYEKPDGMDTNAIVSYTDPLSVVTTKISFDPTCSPTAQGTANGWNFDTTTPPRVRLCGDACTNLRTTLTNTGNAFLAQMKPAPDVPLTALEACAASQ